jgi:hypothetical protein
VLEPGRDPLVQPIELELRSLAPNQVRQFAVHSLGWRERLVTMQGPNVQ